MAVAHLHVNFMFKIEKIGIMLKTDKTSGKLHGIRIITLLLMISPWNPFVDSVAVSKGNRP